jgi:hypothetical protein
VFHRLIERMNVMKRANKEECIKIAIVKIRLCGQGRIHAHLSRRGDGITIAIDRYDGIAVLRQTRRQLARSATDLQDAPAISRKRPPDEVVGKASLESHLFVLNSLLALPCSRFI